VAPRAVCVPLLFGQVSKNPFLHCSHWPPCALQLDVDTFLGDLEACIEGGDALFDAALASVAEAVSAGQLRTLRADGISHSVLLLRCSAREATLNYTPDVVAPTAKQHEKKRDPTRSVQFVKADGLSLFRMTVSKVGRLRTPLSMRTSSLRRQNLALSFPSTGKALPHTKELKTKRTWFNWDSAPRSMGRIR
jgi:hypothetical protein